MNLGILTFHCAHNYGALLQCYALQEYLKRMGHNVSVIDYRPQYLNRIYSKNSVRLWFSRGIASTIKKFCLELKLHSSRVERYNRFNNFISSRLNLAPYSVGMDFSDYDAVFVGSDQVWDKNICGGVYDPVYFGVNAKCHVIPYAVSNKLSVLSEDDAKFFKSQLPRFSDIGVREKKLQELLQPFTKIIIQNTIDPTLLAGPILINNIENERLLKDKYILIYEVVEHQNLIDIAREYAKIHGYKVVILSAYLTLMNVDIKDQVASPTEFVNYIRYAECVFTTSFHGTALSIILKKRFYSFRQHNNSDQRIDSLLSLVGLNDRFIEIGSNINDNEINYLDVDYKLATYVEDSRKFISMALSKVK